MQFLKPGGGSATAFQLLYLLAVDAALAAGAVPLGTALPVAGTGSPVLAGATAVLETAALDKGVALLAKLETLATEVELEFLGAPSVVVVNAEFDVFT